MNEQNFDQNKKKSRSRFVNTAIQASTNGGANRIKDVNKQTISSLLLEQAGYLLNVPKIFIKRLLLPDIIYKNNILVPLPSQSVIVSGIRIQYSNILGPYRGGLRVVSHSRTPDLVNIGRANTLRSAVSGVPFGGAVGVLQLNQEVLDKGEFNKVVRFFVGSLANIIGLQKDIITPDFRADAHVIDAIVNAYSKVVGEFTPEVVTGKSLGLKGTLLYQDAIGLVGLYVLEYLIKIATESNSLSTYLGNLQGLDKPISVIIQGFGKVGKAIALALFYKGYKIIGVSDTQGAIVAENGIDIEQLISTKQEYGSVVRYRKAKIISNKEFYALPADIFILAAKENMLTRDAISIMHASVIMEIASAAVKAEAFTEILKQGKLYIPDILAGMGESLIGLLEYEQNKNDIFYPKTKLTHLLEQKAVDRLDKIVDFMLKYDARLELATYILALQEIYNKYRG